MRYVFAPLGLLSSLLVGLWGFFVGSMTCDDGCAAEPDHWTDDKNAAEWGNILLYSGGVVVAACVLLGAVIARTRGLAVGALLVQSAFLFGLIRLLTALGTSDSGMLFLVAPFVLGVATLAGLQWDIRRPSGP